MVVCIVLCLMVGNGDMAAVSIFAWLLGTSIAPEPGEAGERMQVPWLVFPLVCITNFHLHFHLLSFKTMENGAKRVLAAVGGLARPLGSSTWV